MPTPIKDTDDTVHGYLEKLPDGTLIALDRNYRRKGIYDAARNVTLDSSGKHIASGNVLTDLLLGYFSSR